MEKNLKRENNFPHSYWASDVSFPESPGRASGRGCRLVLVPSVRVCCLETRLEDIQGNKNAKLLPLQWLTTLWLPSPISPAGDSLKNPHSSHGCVFCSDFIAAFSGSRVLTQNWNENCFWNGKKFKYFLISTKQNYWFLWNNFIMFYVSNPHLLQFKL